MAALRGYCERYIHWIFVLSDCAGQSYTAEVQRFLFHEKIAEECLALNCSDTAKRELDSVLHNLDREIGLPVDAPDLEYWERQVKEFGRLLCARLSDLS